MTLYVDYLQKYPTGLWCHLWADEPDELHAFARKIGLKREWAQVSRGTIVKEFLHYDLRPSKRELAVRHGAVELSLKDWLMDQMRDSAGYTPE